MTHYILPLTQQRGDRQLTACGEWARAREHSAEPTCPQCRSYLLDDADPDGAIAATFDDPTYATTSEPVRPERDFRAEYERRYR